MADESHADAPSIRLLLIDDEVAFVNLLAKRLKRRGIAITKAYSGKEGVRLLRHHDFDVVVLDLKMVDMDGMEVLKMIKVLVPELPVIMLTGHGSQDAANEVLSAGAFDYLTKPYELDALAEKIEAAAGID